MGLNLAVAVLPGVDYMLILESMTLQEKLITGVIEGLKTNAPGLYKVNNNDFVALCRGDTGEDVSAWHVSV